MRLTVVPPDAERATIDVLTELIDGHLDATVGLGVPKGWTPSSPTHLEVASDGTPVLSWPVMARTTIRVVAYAATPSAAKTAAGLAQGLLLGCSGGHGISAVLPLIGILPARDPDTRADIAWFTVGVSMRLTSI